MIVNHHNIEKWIFDYFEGNLSLHEQIELRDFIKKNPQYADEFEAWEEARLDDDGVVPMYPNAQSLMVAEQSLLQRSWKYAAAVVVLIGTSLTLYFTGNPFEETTGGSTVSDATDLILSPEYGLNPVVALTSTDNSPLVSGSGQSGENTPLTSLNEPLSVSGASASGAGNGGSLNEKLKLLERIDGRRVNPEIFRSAGASDVTEIKNNLLAKEIRRQKEKAKRSVEWFLAKRKRKQSARDAMAQDIMNNKRDNHKEMAKIRAKNQKEDSRQKKSERKKHEPLFDRDLALTNVHDPIMIIDNEVPTEVNPALVGGLAAPRLNFGYRNQWSGTGNATSTYLVSFDQYIEQLHGGLGFAMGHSSYENGMYNGYSASVSYAPRLDISRSVSLTAGIQFSVNRMDVNFENYNYDSQMEIERGVVYDTYSSGYAPRADKIMYKDVSMGLMLNTSHFYVGGSVDHLFEPGQNLYNDDLSNEHNLNRKYSVQIGTDYQRHATSGFIFSPQMIFTNQAGNSELWISGITRFKMGSVKSNTNWIAGAGFSSNSSLKGVVGVGGKRLRLTYGFDFTESKVSDKLQGSHEASLRVLLNDGKRKSPLAFL